MLHRLDLKFKKELDYRTEHSTKYIVIHHSEVSTPHTAEDVHQWHLTRGWDGIGYHYFISKKGEIYEGRPHDTIGAHAIEVNRESVGVCFEGNFNKETMGETQLNASVMLLCLLSLAYDDAEICEHKQISNEKSCPGKKFPFDSLMKKVNDCKATVRDLFGNPISESFVVDDEWRNFHNGFGDEEEERRRHNAWGLAHYGNFNYKSILDLFSEIYEEYGWK